MHLDLQLLLGGLGTVGALALLAAGLVVTFKGSGVLNLAHGALATAAAYIYIGLFHLGCPLVVAMAGGLLSAVALAAMFQLFILRRMSDAPALAKVVGTLGLMILITGAVNSITGSAIPQAPTLFPQAVFSLPIGRPAFTIGQGPFWIFLIALLATGVLWAVDRWTRFGIITRALGENEQAVSLTGTSVQRMALINWCWGAALAGAAGILLSSMVPIDSTLFTSALITAIAAALIGGLKSFWLTWVGALGIGLAQPLLDFYSADLQKYSHVSGWSDALPFLVIAVVVLARGKVIPLRDAASQAILPRVRLPRHPVRAACGAFVLGIAWFTFMPISWISPMASTLIGAQICLSLVVIVGFVGQISLVQMEIAGFGAFSTAIFAPKLFFPLCLILGALTAVPVGLVIGIPALRVRGIQLAIVTLGAALVIDDMIFSGSSYAGGDVGRFISPAKIVPRSLNGVTEPLSFGNLCLTIFCLCILGIAAVRRSRLGQQFLAVRVNERGASASGVSVTKTKLIAFAISSFIAGIAGGLLAYQSLLITGTTFDVTSSIQIMGTAYIGGITSFAGAFIGGMFIPGGVLNYLGNLIWNSDWNQALAGVALLSVVANHPSGVAGIPEQIREALRRREAHRSVAGTAGDLDPGELRRLNEHRTLSRLRNTSAARDIR